MTWADILAHWAAVEADLHSEYGIDVEEPGLMQARSWRWLEVRVTGLLSTDTRITRIMREEASDGAQARGAVDDPLD